MQKLFNKVFGAARMDYSKSGDKFETKHHKPGGTAFGALGKLVNRVVDSRWDETGCGRWFYITYSAKECKRA
jgi:hypothetical protein